MIKLYNRFELINVPCAKVATFCIEIFYESGIIHHQNLVRIVKVYRVSETHLTTVTFGIASHSTLCSNKQIIVEL